MAVTEPQTAGGAGQAVSKDTRGAGPGRVVLGLALSVLSAVMLFVMCDGHGNLWPLVIVGFVPMYLAQYRLLPRRWSGVAVGIAFFGYWYSLWLFGGSELGYPFCALASVVMAVAMGVIGMFERPFSERTDYRWFIFQLPVVWVGLEVIFGGNPLFGSNFWIAYRMAPVPALDQAVSYLSTPALSLVLMLINAGIALLIMRWMDGRWPQLASVPIPARTVKWSSIIAFGLALVWIGSSLVINWQVNSQLGATVRVAAAQTGTTNTTDGVELQSGLPQGSPEEKARNVRLQAQLERMTRSAAGQGAQLVVWPEWILQYDARTAQGAWVGRLAKETNTTIVAGYIPESPLWTGPNMAGVWLPSGVMADAPYYKIHPVIMEGESFSTPQQFPTFRTPFGQLGVIICYDHDFPNDSVRYETIAGAEIMAVPALDPVDISPLRWQSLTFRAIENRVPMVKTDVAWDSAIVNANGVLAQRVAISAPQGAEALLVSDVNLGPRNAPFTVYGGYTFAFVIVVAFLARYVYQFLLARRLRRPDDD